MTGGMWMDQTSEYHDKALWQEVCEWTKPQITRIGRYGRRYVNGPNLKLPGLGVMAGGMWMDQTSNYQDWALWQEVCEWTKPQITRIGRYGRRHLNGPNLKLPGLGVMAGGMWMDQTSEYHDLALWQEVCEWTKHHIILIGHHGKRYVNGANGLSWLGVMAEGTWVDQTSDHHNLTVWERVCQ